MAVLDRMRAELPVRISAFTTPKPDSDLDSFIREFGDDHLAAWGAVVKLLAQRKPWYRRVRQIKINNRQLRDISNDATEALLDKNDPPCIFVRSSNLTRVRQDENGRPQIDVLSEPQLRGRLTRVTDFYLDMGEELKSVSPPKDDGIVKTQNHRIND